MSKICYLVYHCHQETYMERIGVALDIENAKAAAETHLRENPTTDGYFSDGWHWDEKHRIWSYGQHGMFRTRYLIYECPLLEEPEAEHGA